MFGFIGFVCVISFLIIGEVRSIIDMKDIDDVSGDDYFDDFETL